MKNEDAQKFDPNKDMKKRKANTEMDIKKLAKNKGPPLVEGPFYRASLTIKAMYKLPKNMKPILARVPGRLERFRRTVFGPWIDFTAHHGDPYLVHVILQTIVRDKGPSDTLHFRVGEYDIRFGPHEFCLISGLRFGPLQPLPVDVHCPGTLRGRVFPSVRHGVSLCGHDLYNCLNSGDRFDQLTDDDAVRVCLLLLYTVFFRGWHKHHAVPDEIVALVDDLDAWDKFPWGLHLWSELLPLLWDALPSRYDDHLDHLAKGIEPKWTFIGSFIYPFKAWIFETFPYTAKHVKRDPRRIPRGLGWTRTLAFRWEKIMQLLRVDIPARRPIMRMMLTASEREAEWWISSCAYFADPIVVVPSKQRTGPHVPADLPPPSSSSSPSDTPSPHHHSPPPVSSPRRQSRDAPFSSSLPPDVPGILAALQKEIAGLQGGFAGMQGQIVGLQGEVAGLQGQVAGLREEVDMLRGHHDGAGRHHLEVLFKTVTDGKNVVEMESPTRINHVKIEICNGSGTVVNEQQFASDDDHPIQTVYRVDLPPNGKHISVKTIYKDSETITFEVETTPPSINRVTLSTPVKMEISDAGSLHPSMRIYVGTLDGTTICLDYFFSCT